VTLYFDDETDAARAYDRRTMLKPNTTSNDFNFPNSLSYGAAADVARVIASLPSADRAAAELPMPSPRHMGGGSAVEHDGSGKEEDARTRVSAAPKKRKKATGAATGATTATAAAAVAAPPLALGSNYMSGDDLDRDYVECSACKIWRVLPKSIDVDSLPYDNWACDKATWCYGDCNCSTTQAMYVAMCPAPLSPLASKESSGGGDNVFEEEQAAAPPPAAAAAATHSKKRKKGAGAADATMAFDAAADVARIIASLVSGDDDDGDDFDDGEASSGSRNDDGEDDDGDGDDNSAAEDDGSGDLEKEAPALKERRRSKC